MKLNIDLHLHSPYAAAVSKNMSIPVLAREAKLKGLDLIGTGDILHPKWLEHCKENLKEENDCYYFKEDQEKKTYFLLTTEVETKGRVHHLIFFKNFEVVEKFKKEIEKYSSDMNVYGGGRPRLSLLPDQLLDVCVNFDVLIGPAHAFTPYFGIYAGNNSLKAAYGKNYKKIKFIELGLSADTKSANIIPELKELIFFSFSDAHSPNSFRIGREFICADLNKPNYESIKELLENKEKLLFNVGYNPKEGKYNKSACRECKQIYSLEDAIKYNWKCAVCKGTIKKGVEDRCKEIARDQGNNEYKEITKRPEYKYLMPLAQVIQTALNKKQIQDKEVIEIYEKMLKVDTEINLMLNTPKETLEKIDPNISKYIIAFRKDLVVFRPGGAGHYGVPFICFSEDEKRKTEEKIKKEQEIKVIQKTLF